MKKIKIGEKYWIWKLGAICFTVAALGTFIISLLAYIFGFVPVFFACVAIVAVSGLVLSIAQIYQKTWLPLINTHKKKQL